MSAARGYSLVELMVALVLTLLVVGGSLAALAQAQGLQRSSEALARLEEVTDSALEILVQELRHTGYLGLAPPGSPVAGASAVGTPEASGLAVGGGCVASLAHDLAQPLFAADARYGAGVPLGCRPGPAGRSVAGADTLILRRASALQGQPDPGRLQLETTGRSARLVADGSTGLGPGARWHDLEVSVFYVGADSTGEPGRPSLRRRSLVGGVAPAFQDEELVPGIADLQLELGLDDPADDDTAVDRWIGPGAGPQGAELRALRLWVLALADVPEPGLVPRPALVYANRELAADRSRRLRRVAGVTVELRNGPLPW